MSSGLTKKKTKQKGAGEGRAMEMSALTQNEKQKRTENSTEQKQKGIERNKLLKSNRNACPRFFNATRSLYTRREITPRGFTSTHRNKFEFQKSVYHVRRDRTTWYIRKRKILSNCRAGGWPPTYRYKFFLPVCIHP